MARNRLCRSVPGFSWCRESAGGLLKESPGPPRTFLEFIIDGATARARFRKTATPPHPLRRRGQAPPPQYLLGWYCKRRKRSNAGAPGAKPPAKLTYSLPLPRRGRGSGGWGQESKLKAGIAGDQKGKPPCGFRNGKVSRRPKSQAPLPPLPPKKPPPWLTCTETQPRIVHPVQPAERNAKKIRKLFGKPVDKPRKECYNGNATGAWQCATCR